MCGDRILFPQLITYPCIHIKKKLFFLSFRRTIIFLKLQNVQTFVRLNCRFPLYHVIIAFGLDPELSQVTSYLRSATNELGLFSISAVSGFTRK